MAKTIPLSAIDTYLQDRLRTTVGVRVSQTERVRLINQTIQLLQSSMNLDTTKRIITFDYLSDESDYSVVNDLGIDDFKDAKAIRDPNNAYERFDPEDEETVDEFIKEGRVTNVYCVEERDNTDILRLIYRNGNTRLTLAALNSLTEDGTWASDASTSDAGTLAANADRFKKGSGSLEFDIDVSQSVNNKASIRNTTLTTVDLSGYQNIGHFRSWLDLQQLTAAQLATISSAEIRFGSSSSAYGAVTVTTPINGGTWKAGWNRVSWDWADVSETGSPDYTAVDYVELILNYSASMTDANNVKWDDLVVILPRELEMVYFSQYMVSVSGTLQEEFTITTINTAETLLLPTANRDDFVHLCAVYGFQQMKHEGSQADLKQKMQADDAFKRIFANVGHRITREKPSIMVHGNSAGRVERRMW